MEQWIEVDSDDYSVFLLHEKVDLGSTDHPDHHLVQVAKNNPSVVLYWVRFQCFLQSGESHSGMLFHLFSKAMLDDGPPLDFFEYFEDFVRTYIQENGFPLERAGQPLN